MFIDTASLRTPPANATQQACPPRGQLRIIAAVVNSRLNNGKKLCSYKIA